ncbi:MAG: hypothetical protein H0S84_05040 [Bacteroidales bacterium]|jgi:hypothetical protein|nr:hypothetical protein [Bacteroidales bacterium]
MKILKLILSTFLLLVIFNSTVNADGQLPENVGVKLPAGIEIRLLTPETPNLNSISATLTISGNGGIIHEVQNITLHPLGGEYGEILVRLDENSFTGWLSATVNFTLNGCSYQGTISRQGTFVRGYGYTMEIESFYIINCF